MLAIKDAGGQTAGDIAAAKAQALYDYPAPFCSRRPKGITIHGCAGTAWEKQEIFPWSLRKYLEWVRQRLAVLAAVPAMKVEMGMVLECHLRLRRVAERIASDHRNSNRDDDSYPRSVFRNAQG